MIVYKNIIKIVSLFHYFITFSKRGNENETTKIQNIIKTDRYVNLISSRVNVTVLRDANARKVIIISGDCGKKKI